MAYAKKDTVNRPSPYAKANKKAMKSRKKTTSKGRKR